MKKVLKGKELEDTILGAEDKLYALEYQLYCEVRDTIAKEVARIENGCIFYHSVKILFQKNRGIFPL